MTISALEVVDERPVGLAGAVVEELIALRRGFRNWPAAAARIAHGRLRGSAPGLSLRTRRGAMVTTPAGDASWWTAVETFGRDCYRLASMDLGERPVFVDVGANIGAFALDVLTRWPRARGVCLEPAPSAYAALLENLAQYDADGRAFVRRLAVVGSADAGIVRLFERTSSSCLSTLVPERAPTSDGGGRWVEVEAVSLNALLADFASGVDLLKIDVEGAEYEIVLGTPVTALSVVRNVVIEYHQVVGHSVDELADHLGEAGFRWRRWHRSRVPDQGVGWWERA